MPNWCLSSITFYGNKKAIKDLNNKIICYTKKPSRVKNGFGENWLGNIIDGFGLDWSKESCRGEIDNIQYKEGSLMISEITAWMPLTSMWDNIINKYYMKEGKRLINYVLFSQSEENDVYVNTDKEGKFFTERYVYRIFHEDCEDDTEEEEDKYFNSDKELLEYFHTSSVKETFDKVKEEYEDNELYKFDSSYKE